MTYFGGSNYIVCNNEILIIIAIDYNNQDFGDIQTYLEEQGFVCFAINGSHHSYIESQTALQIQTTQQLISTLQNQIKHPPKHTSLDLLKQELKTTQQNLRSLLQSINAIPIIKPHKSSRGSTLADVQQLVAKRRK